MPERSMLTPAQAAQDEGLNLGLSESAIRRRCREGLLPCYDYGDGYRLDREELLQWKNAQKKGPAV